MERLDYDAKEGVITIDILKEQNQDAKSELEELRKQISELRTAQKDASTEDKEKKKQEKMAMMMAKFDSVSLSVISIATSLPILRMYFSRADFQRRRNNCELSSPSWITLTLERPSQPRI